MALRVLTAILFFPRGGSGHLARGLVAGLRDLGCEVTLVAGSRSDLSGHGDARRFYGDVRAVDFDAALSSDDPLGYEAPAGSAPMHPSYEERADAPDRVFAALDDTQFERQVQAWARELQDAGAAQADVLHLHHLTPLNEAARRVASNVPVVGQLHGTELLMLEEIAAGAPSGWTYADRWAQRLREWADGCTRLLVAPGGTRRAAELLALAPERMTELSGGVDTDLFAPDKVDRARFWREVLVEDPQGWLPGQDAGSARYSSKQVERLADEPVLVYVGRFTAVKRLPQLIECFVAARRRSGQGSLVLVGGHPGEWEGEHPAETVDRIGADAVFLAGWHEHDDLPGFFNAADAVVSAAAREQFGQLLVEGMATGLPAVALRAMGPAGIIEDGRTGWLADVDDPQGLADALAQVLGDESERRRRGQAARHAVQERFSWTAVSEQLLGVLAAATGRGSTDPDRRRQPASASADGRGRRPTNRPPERPAGTR